MAEFALDLDHAAIALLRREGGGPWEALGRAPLDAPDLDARLRALREEAAGWMGGRAAVRLLIPDSQILHLDLAFDPEWDALDDEARHEAVAAAIEARTDQPAEDLAFDWREEAGGRVRAAVVAADTLRDAAGFASAYGFAPTGFGAWPDADAFPDEPDFGAPPEAGTRPGDEAEPEAEARTAPAEPASAPAAKGERLAGAITFALHRGSRAQDAPEASRADAPRRGEARAPVAVPFPPPAPRRRARGLLVAGALAGLVALGSALALTGGLGEGEEAPRAALEPATSERAVASAPDASPPPEPRPFDAEPVVVPVPASDAAARRADGPPEAEPEAEAETVEIEAAEAGEVRGAEAPEADPALASYAATGIWRTAPAPLEAPAAQEAAAPASARAPAAEAPLALVAARLVPPTDRAGDAAPPALAPPPPPGEAVGLGAGDGVRPTPEGAVTPEGVTLYAAAPPRRPPARPEAAPLAPAGTPDLALAGFRPPERPNEAAAAPDPAAGDPAELEPEPGAEGAPDASAERVAAAVADARAAEPALSLLPVAPTDAAPRAAAVDAAVAASLFRAPETPPEVTLGGPQPVPEGAGSAFAVAGSLRPVVRPEEVAAALAEARAAAAAAPPSEQATPTVAPAPMPTVATPAAAQPEIPTQASVARRATVDNALAMNRLSLVGVFGAEGARRALVRLPSGRFEKVRVGDRLDGGQVHTIESGRLVFVRRGRAYAIEMPRG